MNDHQFAIRMLRDEMISDALQAGCQVDAEFVHAREMIEMLHRAGHIGHDIRQSAIRKSFGAPKILNQRAAFLRDIACGMNRDGTIVKELGRLTATGQQASDDNREQAKRGVC